MLELLALKLGELNVKKSRNTESPNERDTKSKSYANLLGLIVIGSAIETQVDATMFVNFFNTLFTRVFYFYRKSDNGEISHE